MNLKIQNIIKNFYSCFNKKFFVSYYKTLKAKPQKATSKFLTKLIVQNSKIDRQNNKLFPGLKTENLNELSDDEEFFAKAIVFLIIGFFLWLFLFFIYLIFN